MTKSEIVIAVEAYEAGYTKACEDFIRASLRASKQTLENAVRQVVEEDWTRARNEYFGKLNKKLTPSSTKPRTG